MNKKFIYPPKTRTDFLHDIVKAMVKRRIELGMTQEDVNYALNVADRLVSKWECGIRTPASFSLYCWADALKGQIVFVPNGDAPLNISMLQRPSNDNLSEIETAANDNALIIVKNKIKKAS